MDITRSQVNAAKDALGLDHDLTYSITITPQNVYVQTVSLADGYPEVKDGLTLMDSESADIEEDTP
ncbi:hypothetical protein ACTXM8_04740 [Brachybacterium alimentarium]|uniref:hypothetical protein n=1 Tax=Brachybacterium alimentarium TaxID=47845 RepID=UPI003FD2659D